MLVLFFLENFSYTSHACFIFLWRVSLTHAGLFCLFYFSFLSGEFLLHIPCWLHFYLGSLLYTYFCLGSFLHILGWLILSLIFFFFCGEFLSLSLSLSLSLRYLKKNNNNIFCLFLFLFFHQGSFSYTSRAGFIFNWGVSLTYPVIPFLSWEFLLHIRCRPLFFFFFFFFPSLSEVFLLPVLTSLFSSSSFFFFFIIFYLECFSYTSRAGFILTGEFLLHIP